MTNNKLREGIARTIHHSSLGCEYHSMSIGEFGNKDGDSNYFNQVDKLADVIIDRINPTREEIAKVIYDEWGKCVQTDFPVNYRIAEKILELLEGK